MIAALPKTLRDLADLAEWHGKSRHASGIVTVRIPRGRRRRVSLVVMTEQVWQRLNREDVVKYEAF